MKKIIDEIKSNLDKNTVIKCYGNLGSGKTTFAKNFINTIQNNNIKVASPTFSIVEYYEHETHPIWHFDLYRLGSEEDLWDVDFETAISTGVSIIEWPEIIDNIKLENKIIKLNFCKDDNKHYIENSNGIYESTI